MFLAKSCGYIGGSYNNTILAYGTRIYCCKLNNNNNNNNNNKRTTDT